MESYRQKHIQLAGEGHKSAKQASKEAVGSEGKWENDPVCLKKECSRLWHIVNSEDLGGPVIPYDQYQNAQRELERLEHKHHKLTRRPGCDCWLCRHNGWWVAPAPAKFKSKTMLAAFLDGEEGNEGSCGYGCCCRAYLDCGCDTGCICDECMQKAELCLRQQLSK